MKTFRTPVIPRFLVSHYRWKDDFCSRTPFVKSSLYKSRSELAIASSFYITSYLHSLFMAWIASASIAVTIKGANTSLWVFYALFLGPIALVHALLRPRTPNRFVSGPVASIGVVPCPKCDEFIDPKATVCPRCRQDITPSPVETEAPRTE